MAIGIIVVSIIFVISASNILYFQTDRSVASHEDLANNVGATITVLQSYNMSISHTYSTDITSYSLKIDEANYVLVETPEGGVSTYPVQSNVTVENGEITDSEHICIEKKSGGTVYSDFVLKEGEC